MFKRLQKTLEALNVQEATELRVFRDVNWKKGVFFIGTACSSFIDYYTNRVLDIIL